MSKKRWLVIGMVTAILATGTWIAAEAVGFGPMGNGKDGFANKPLGRLIRANLGRLITLKAELNVTPEQKEAMKFVLEKEKQNFVPMVKQVVEGRRALRKAMMSEKKDEAAIRRAADQIGKAIGDAAVLGSKVVAEAKMILSPKQVELLEKFQIQRESSVDAWLSEIAH